MLGQPLDLLMPPDYRRRHSRDVASFFATGSPHGAIDCTLELPGIRRDGTVFPIELSLSVGKRGDERFVLAVIREITARRRAEELVRIQRDLGISQSSTTKLSTALEQVLDACCRIEGIDCGVVYRVDHEANHLQMVMHRNVPPDFVEQASFFPNTKPLGLQIELDHAVYGPPRRGRSGAGGTDARRFQVYCRPADRA